MEAARTRPPLEVDNNSVVKSLKSTTSELLCGFVSTTITEVPKST